MEKVVNLLKEESLFKNTKPNDSFASFLLSDRSLFAYGMFINNEENILVVENNLYNAQKVYDFLDGISSVEVLSFFYDETLRIGTISSSKDFLTKRLETLFKISKSKKKKIIVTHTLGLLHFLPSSKSFKENIVTLKENDVYSKEGFEKTLFKLGYQKRLKVETSLEYASRGGVVDFFGVGSNNPIRIEFFDNKIESIREFNIQTQRTIKVRKKIDLFLSSEFFHFLDEKIKQKAKKELEEQKENLDINAYKNLKNTIKEDFLDNENSQFTQSDLKYLKFFDKKETLTNYLDNNTTIIFSFLDKIKENYETLLNENIEYEKELFSKGKTFNNNSLFKKTEEVIMDKTKKIYLKKDLLENKETKRLPFKEVLKSSKNIEMLEKQILAYLNEGKKINIVLSNDNQIETFKKMFESKDLINKISIYKDYLLEGFEYKNKVFLTSYEIFEFRETKRSFFDKYKSSSFVSSFEDFKKGDYVVHDIYGVGIFKEIKTIKTNKFKKDYLKIEYRGEQNLYVPLQQIGLVKKYSSNTSRPPFLNSLGSKDFIKTKAKIKKNIKELAIDLANLYEKRSQKIGFSFPPDDIKQMQFEKGFVFEHTKDQKNAISKIKKKMENKAPMDVLLCGDVGFGKTEVAFCAGFKAFKAKKQVAFITPTTLLSNQHFENAVKRFKGYNVKIALINRFKTLKEQKTILKNLKEGKIDIIIGTHRLLSSDINFKDLGLLIVDEEQRFGVEHKEKITNYKKNIDVLTLSATPIPRTMQMSLMGIRTLIELNTAPKTRLPIQTFVIEKDQKTIKEIIQRELARKGQVFYLYNNTFEIENIAYKLSLLIPFAKIAVIHGKMNKEQIDKTSYNFYNGNIDILVCTTIIENGIDVSNANTIIVDGAENFGLSQLYQIKGRVGRKDKLAYAYLMIKSNKNISEIAQKRIQTIKDFSELGSGHQIALRDLSIRGAGDILGEKQTGFIENVGIDLYLRLLKEAIDEQKDIKTNHKIKQKKEEKKQKLQIDGHIPLNYASYDENKVSLYKKIEKIVNLKKLARLKEEIIDQYGKIDNEVDYLLKGKEVDILLSYDFVYNYIQQSTFVEVYLKKEFSSKKNIGLQLFQLINNISKEDIKVTFRNERIVIRIKKRTKKWLFYLYEILKELSKEN